MKTNWFHLCARLTSYSLVFLCLSLRPAPHSDLNTKPTRPDPEGESSPPKTDHIQRMESPAKKDADRRLTTPTKSDVIPRSPGSPASPAPRSKRKEGKMEIYVTCMELSCLKVKLVVEAEFGLTWSSSYDEVRQLSWGEVLLQYLSNSDHMLSDVKLNLM